MIHAAPTPACGDAFAFATYPGFADRVSRCFRSGKVGTVEFVGPTSFQPGIWVGIVLDSPDGKNDGTVNGEFYFDW